MPGVFLALLVLAGAAPPIQLEVRVFDGVEDVSQHTRVTIYRAGSREDPIVSPSRGPRHIVEVEPGLYDVQAIHERNGQVAGLRWAERLAVLAYPDEGGRHLEVVNLKTGYGALQVRGREAALAGLALAATAPRDRTPPYHPAARADDWALFVVPAGRYTLTTRGGAARDIEIPADHTRLTVLP